MLYAIFASFTLANVFMILMSLVVARGFGPEGYFMTSMANYNDDLTTFFTRPKSAVLMALAAGFVIWALVPEVKSILRGVRGAPAPRTVSEDGRRV